MPFELPLFPLNVVLFPGMSLPLHIFEPRYRLMIRRCLEGDRTFGVALIVEGQEGLPGTVPAAAGCTAEITEVTPFADGRMNLQTIGRRRFRVISMREEDEYLIGSVEWLDDAPAEPHATEVANRVRCVLRRYLSRLARNVNLANINIDDIEVPDDPYALSMWVAALIALPKSQLHQKQNLLEMTSTAQRLETEYSLLCRAEIVQRACERRAPQLSPVTPDDESLGPFARFVSLN